MSYSDEAMTAKFASLNDTQDSIVTVAQWILFYRRFADQIASRWLTRLQESNPSKRLNLVYLANEVAQQSRARGKTEFLVAFEPIVSDGLAVAYKSASQDVQGKIKRVVEVWRQRNIFDPSIQETTEKRLEEIDQQRGGGRSNGTGAGKRLGGSLFGGSGGNIPSALETVAKLQADVTKTEINAKPAVDKAKAEYAKMTDPDTPIPTAPLHAAKLSALMKALATALGAAEASVKAREALVTELERLVEGHRAKLVEESTITSEIMERRDTIENKKREVEDNIMRGMSTPTSPENPTPDPFDQMQANGTGRQRSGMEMEAPDHEDLTPPRDIGPITATAERLSKAMRTQWPELGERDAILPQWPAFSAGKTLN